MIVSLSAMPASRGISSQMSMPGTFVAIGRNSPRISAGASGLRSNVSRCVGPPGNSTMMMPLAGLRTPLCASARRMSGSASPPSASPPIRSQLRRDMPSQ